MAHHRQVVADEHVRQAQFVLEPGQQVDHLGPDRHVERRRWLVQHKGLRLDSKCTGDGDALSLAAGKLMGVPRPETRGEGDHAEQLVYACAPLRPACDEVVNGQDFAQGRCDGEARVERRKGVLEDELYLAGKDPPARSPVDGSSHELDAARSGFLEAYQEPAQGGLTAAALADDTERGRCLQGDAHPPQSPNGRPSS